MAAEEVKCFALHCFYNQTVDGMSRMMQTPGYRHVRYFNHICERTATPWEGRFELCVVDTEKYMLICKHVSFEKSGYRSKRALVIFYNPYG